MVERKKKFGGTIRFQELMDNVNAHFAELTDLVILMIKEGRRALIKDDEGLYRDLQTELEKVHVICYELEDAILSSIALHQPFAQDLRYILSTLKIINEIHRSAHDAVHVANSSTYVDLKIHADMVKRIGKLADKASKMFKLSIDAFRARKAPSVEEWKDLDDEVDTIHEEIINEMVELMEKDTTWSRAGVSLILATRYIERIADHACNIVEESIYVVTSKRVKIE